MVSPWKTLGKAGLWGMIAVAAMICLIGVKKLQKKPYQPVRQVLYTYVEKKLKPQEAVSAVKEISRSTQTAYTPRAAAPEIVSKPETKAELKLDAPGLWELQERLRRDYRREILDRKFSFSGGKINLNEISPTGLLSFTVINEGEKDILLPELQCPACSAPVRLYLERRVIEPGSYSAGILAIENIQKIKELNLFFQAVNIKQTKIKVEVPKWSIF